MSTIVVTPEQVAQCQIGALPVFTPAQAAQVKAENPAAAPVPPAQPPGNVNTSVPRKLTVVFPVRGRKGAADTRESRDLKTSVLRTSTSQQRYELESMVGAAIVCVPTDPRPAMYKCIEFSDGQLTSRMFALVTDWNQPLEVQYGDIVRDPPANVIAVVFFNADSTIFVHNRSAILTYPSAN